MNRIEYMGALRKALSALPAEDLANALRYYEEYFDDAGVEYESKVISELGAPEKVAAQILEDYKELTILPSQENTSQQYAAYGNIAKKASGIPAALWIIILVFALPILGPLALALVMVVLSLILVAACVFLIFLLIPVILGFTGFAICLFSFMLWSMPASALVTLGTGLSLLAIGIAGTYLMAKACSAFVPAMFRGFIALCRWPIDKFKNRGGAK